MPDAVARSAPDDEHASTSGRCWDTSGSGRKPGRRLAGLLLALSVSLPLAAGSAARAQGDGQRLDAAFAAMMARPDDPGTALAYARLAAAQGQPRAAIAALERVLRAHPDLDQLRLELASLYLAAGSADMATIYARRAVQSPDMPPEIAGRANTLLSQAEQGSARSVFRGTLFTGFRYDTNANFATTLGTVNLYSPDLGEVPVQPGVRGRGDWSSVTSGALSHSYDLGRQFPASWETNASAYGQFFFRIRNDYNPQIAQADTGPRIGVGHIGDAAVSVRSFLSAGWVGFDGDTYSTLYGGGMSVQAQAQRWAVSLTGQGRFGNYQDSSFRPLTRPYNGPEWNFTLTGLYQLTPSTTVTAAVSYYEAEARVEAYTRRGPGGSVSIVQTVPILGQQVELALRSGVQHLNYAGPNGFINPFSDRADTLVDAGISVALPLPWRLPVGKTVSVVGQYGFLQNFSTYDVYRFTDHSFTLGLRANF